MAETLLDAKRHHSLLHKTKNQKASGSYNDSELTETEMQVKMDLPSIHQHAPNWIRMEGPCCKPNSSMMHRTLTPKTGELLQMYIT